jgi:hypothetical protein
MCRVPNSASALGVGAGLYQDNIQRLQRRRYPRYGEGYGYQDKELEITPLCPASARTTRKHDDVASDPIRLLSRRGRNRQQLLSVRGWHVELGHDGDAGRHQRYG